MRTRERKRRERIRRELRRVLRALRTHDLEIEVGWMFDDREILGEYEGDGENGRIRIDPWKDMADTIVHEVLHHLETATPHRRIHRRAAYVVRYATPRQLRTLLGYAIFRWIATLSDRRRAMPPCPMCGRKLRRFPLVERMKGRRRAQLRLAA